ncbi:MAG: Crp/Fnr family transcriptional regulator [Nitrospirota bacterium]
MKKEHVFELFKNIQLFSSLSDKELHQISSKMPVRQFRKNEIILYEEDTNEFMYIILEGKVKIIQISEDGKETILAMHKAGDFFGEMALIDGKTMPATVTAAENTLTSIISRKDFYALIHAQSKVFEKLLEILCARLRESWERIQILNFKSASDRLKMLFFMLSEEYGNKTTEGVTLNIKLTHQDIANMTGITRETVTRVIDRWQKDKEIAILKNKFIHLNPDFMKNHLRFTS